LGTVQPALFFSSSFQTWKKFGRRGGGGGCKKRGGNTPPKRTGTLLILD
jgi:hypothetical protein